MTFRSNIGTDVSTLPKQTFINNQLYNSNFPIQREFPRTFNQSFSFPMAAFLGSPLPSLSTQDLLFLEQILRLG